MSADVSGEQVAGGRVGHGAVVPGGEPGDRFAVARAVADVVLYEGYVLYPYRASSNKNHMRWQFGVLAPPAWAAAEGSERAANRTQLLVQTNDSSTAIDVRIRFLHSQHRTVERVVETADAAAFEPVEVLTVAGADHVAWDEAIEHEVDVSLVDLVALVGVGRDVPFTMPAAREVELLRDDAGAVCGRLVRQREELSGTIHLAAELVTSPSQEKHRDTVAGSVSRLTVEVRNTTDWAGEGAARDEALSRSLLAVHTLLAIDGGWFVSSLDPPDELHAAVKACANEDTFPVLIGAPGSADVVLSSRIILYDYPEIAPESPGDLYDGTEIDEILALRILAMTDEEKAEARGTDKRAAAIVDRVDDLPPELWERLHGAVRSIGPVESSPVSPPPISVGAEPGQTAPMSESSGFDALAPWVPEGVGPGAPSPLGMPGAMGAPAGPAGAPWWDPGADASVDPWSDTVIIDGIEVAKGSKVRLHPSHRSDAHDLFVVDRLATVAGVFHDVEEQKHVAVTLDDDPATEEFQWQGRFWFFFPDEVEPIVSVEPGQ